MSDARLRELERRWRETGSVEDEVAYLRERARTGDLPGLARELQLWEGVERALLSTHERRPTSSILDQLISTHELFVNRLAPSDREVQVCRRIAHAAVRRAAELAGEPQDIAEALALMERFLATEDPEARAALTAVSANLVTATDPMSLILLGRPPRSGEVEDQARAAAGWAADSVALRADPQTGPSGAVERSLSCAWACELIDLRRDKASTSRSASEALGRLRLAIAANLAGWFRGDGILHWAARTEEPL